MVGFHGRGLRPQQPVSEKALPLPPSRQTLTDSVYEAVMELVMDQHIEAGGRGHIDLVAPQPNVSPAPVREAPPRPGKGGLGMKEAPGPAPRRFPPLSPVLHDGDRRGDGDRARKHS